MGNGSLLLGGYKGLLQIIDKMVPLETRADDAMKLRNISKLLAQMLIEQEQESVGKDIDPYAQPEPHMSQQPQTNTPQHLNQMYEETNQAIEKKNQFQSLLAANRGGQI